MILFAADQRSFKELWPQKPKLTFLSCEDPSNFHCQPTDYQQEYKSMQDQIQDYIATDERQHSPLNVSKQQPVLAQFSQDERWYRATVMSVEAETISVFYVDFGNQETLPSSKLYPIPDQFLSLPRLNLSCSLYGVQAYPGDKWNKESIDCFSMLVEKGEFVEARVIKILGNSRLEVSLHSEDFQDFAKHLIDNSHARDSSLLRPVPDHTSPPICQLF